MKISNRGQCKITNTFTNLTGRYNLWPINTQIIQWMWIISRKTEYIHHRFAFNKSYGWSATLLSTDKVKWVHLFYTLWLQTFLSKLIKILKFNLINLKNTCILRRLSFLLFYVTRHNLHVHNRFIWPKIVWVILSVLNVLT